MACDSIDTMSTSPPGSRPNAASRGASASASSSMSASATGHGVTSPSTTTRPTPHTAGGSSYRFANITMSLLRHARDLVRGSLAQQHLVLDELDVGLDANRLVHGLGDPRPDVGTDAAAVGVAHPEPEPVDLALRPDHLEQARARLRDAFDRLPEVAGQHRPPLDDDLVSLAAERPHAPVRAPARARLTRDAHEVVRAVADQRRDLVEERRRHQLAALAVPDGLGAVGLEGLEVTRVLPEVAPVVLPTLGGGADVPHSGMHEQLDAPLTLDQPACSGPDRLACERHTPVARERLREVDLVSRRVLLEREHERAREVVPGGRAELAAEANQLRHVGRLVVHEHRCGADAADRVVNAGTAEREQAIGEVVAGPAAELPELPNEHARPAPGVRRRRRVARRARRREDRAEYLGHLGIETEHAAVGIAVTVAERADRVLVDERNLRVEVVHRLDVVGGDTGGIPRLADQRRALVGPGQQVAEQPLLPPTIDLRPRHRLDLGREITPIHGPLGSELPGAAEAVIPGERVVVLVRNRDDLAELAGAPDDLGRALDELRHVQHVLRVLPDREQPMVRHEDGGPVGDALRDLVGELVGPRRLVVGDLDVAADVHDELLDHGRYRPAREGEHRGVLGVAVHGGVDVVVQAQRREVERLLGRRAALALEHVAVEIGDDEVVERHLRVVERRRRENGVAVGKARAEVPGRALDQVGVQHLLGDPQDGFFRLLRGQLGLAHWESTSGFTRLSGLPPSRSCSRPSAMSVEWFASVSYVAPPMCGVSTTFAIPTSGWSVGRCSPSKWSRPAPPRCPDSSAATRASVSWSMARAVLT